MPRATMTTSSRSSVTGPVTPMIMAPHTRSVPPAPYSAPGDGRCIASWSTPAAAGAPPPHGARGRGGDRGAGGSRRRGADPWRRFAVAGSHDRDDRPDRRPDGPADRAPHDRAGADHHHRTRPAVPAPDPG